jgi:hypothetical protein
MIGIIVIFTTNTVTAVTIPAIVGNVAASAAVVIFIIGGGGRIGQSLIGLIEVHLLLL